MSLSRDLVLSDEVNNTTVGTLIKSIQDINAEDDDQESKVVGHTRKPIRLIINSPGGSVDDGLALIGVIQTSKTEIHTIALGRASSMALYILVCGHKRLMHKMATLMYHDMSSWRHGTLEQNRRYQDECDRVQAMLDDYLVSRTKVKQTQLDKVRAEVRDWYIDADTAKQLAIVDEVI